MRIRTPDVSEMDAAQRAAYEAAVSGRRGHMPAPMRAWIQSPEFAQRAQHLGAFARYETSLPPRLSELAILVTARCWTSHFEWYAHKKEALAAGVSSAIIDAIAQRARPLFEDEQSRVVHDYSLAMHETKKIADDLHRAAVAALGERGVVELVGVLGYYSLVAMTLNAFEIGLPEGEVSDLAE